MIEELRLRGLGVIEDAVLELSPGLTVVTGETGAGKTMVVTGVGLLLGGRADSGDVRDGAGQALVEGRLRLDPTGPVAARAMEAGAVLDDDVLLVSRVVSAEGRSRVHLGGRAAPVAVLAELAEQLVAVHSQGESLRLLRPAAQRAALDAFADERVAGPLATYAGAYAELRSVEAELSEVSAHVRERAAEATVLRAGLGEVERLAPEPGEDDRLRAEVQRLAHADVLGSAARTAHAALLGDEEAPDAADVMSLLGAARKALEGAAGHDPVLAELATRVAEAAYLLADVGADLSSYAEGVDTDPLRLDTVQRRLADLTALARRLESGLDVAAVLEWARHAADRLLDLDDDGRAERLALRRVELREMLAGLAAKLSVARSTAAKRLAREVTAELRSLAMPHAEVRIGVTQREAADGLLIGERALSFGPHGVDEVEWTLVPHQGAPPRPLAKGASGGERSRVMLAVEVVLAGGAAVPTFVFDEVDAGVGGRAAVEVGRRLSRLARSAQVVVVTHLPQVAAFADRHLVVEKSADGRVTTSGVRTLDDRGRVAELSRMLAGLENSALARGHAEELLAVAAGDKRTG